jgi:transposase
VADRGFGNQRFAKLCRENGFDFVLRIHENLRIERQKKIENLEKYKGKNAKFKARVVAWNEEHFFEIRTKNNSTWFLMMSSEMKSGAKKYEQRFSIEKCFQDQKSSGFDMEKCKIKKYDRFKRLYFTMCLAQLLIVIAGEYVETENHPLKKTFPTTADLISVFLSSDLNYSDTVSQK